MFVLAFSLLSAGKAHAASITVATGNDETTVNSNCSLSEAITNINNGDAASYPECTNTTSDPYSTNDTIIIPEGTIVLKADLPQITKSLHISGQGISNTIIDGDGQWVVFGVSQNTDDSFQIDNLKVQSFNSFAIFANSSGGVRVLNIEIDGANAAGNGVLGGIVLSNNTNVDNSVELHDVYIHGLDGGSDGNTGVVIGLGIVAGEGAGVTDATVNNFTVSNLRNLGAVVGLLSGKGVFEGGQGVGYVNTTAENITITNLSSTGNSAVGATSANINGNSANTTTTLNLKNATLFDIRGSNGFVGSSGGIAAVGSASVSAGAVINMGNILVGNTTSNCAVADISQGAGTGYTGTISTVINSSGGNVSDDNTCNSYATKSTDQNNLTELKDFLAPLSSNGGYVPTMELLQGSPAIDAGVPVAGLTTDARGVVRPQGLAYDSGAYESPYAKSSLASTGQNITTFVLLGSILATLSSLVLYYKFQLAQ